MCRFSNVQAGCRRFWHNIPNTRNLVIGFGRLPFPFSNLSPSLLLSLFARCIVAHFLLSSSDSLMKNWWEILGKMLAMRSSGRDRRCLIKEHVIFGFRKKQAKGTAAEANAYKIRWSGVKSIKFKFIKINLVIMTERTELMCCAYGISDTALIRFVVSECVFTFHILFTWTFTLRCNQLMLHRDVPPTPSIMMFPIIKMLGEKNGEMSMRRDEYGIIFWQCAGTQSLER